MEVPEGLKELLQEFTVQVIKKNPDNLVNFACDYFTNLKESNKDNKMSEDAAEVVQIKNINRRKGVAAESFNPNEETDYKKVFIEKSSEQRERLFSCMQGILLFKSLDEDQIQSVIDAMFEKKVSPGDDVITEGEDGDNFYVIEKGQYDIFKNTDKGVIKVGSYDNKGSFGELALMYNTPRAATIKATTDGTLWAMNRETFRNIVLRKAFEKRKMYEELLEKVSILSTLSSYERVSIADALISKSFEANEVIIKQGDPGKEMYFIEDGEVEIKMISDGVEKIVSSLGKGQYFGELALITKQSRAASVISKTKVKLAVLDVESFERLLGPCLDIMKRNFDQYKEQLKGVFGENIPELRE